ncbi:helix-turn-helix domain-containing protein [Clostridium sp. C2-6-12]|uniref:helix-turn-helix domain-containing protein n=1 Tax=Clostridium sp. C2-6-12 TaxID=2698832 RepID=UPI00136CD2D1|nr:helix-turn-helix domain-containing protein [Clostridium sp. C2-6-12]
MKRQVFLPIVHENPYFCFPEAVGWYKDEPQHCAIREKNEFNYFNLHVVISGKGYLKANNHVNVLQPGDSFLYFPSEEQHYYSDKENPWEVVWVHFRGSYLNEFFIEKGFHLSNVWTLKLWNNIKINIINLLEEAENSGILHQSTLSTLTYGIISEFLSQAEALTINKGDIYNKIVTILPKMRELSSKPFNLKYWADELNISTFYFCKMFKKTTGMSPTNFIMLCRLQKSKQLLTEKSELTVKQIALECGYPSISYFGKIFLENEGLTPAEYRKRLV